MALLAPENYNWWKLKDKALSDALFDYTASLNREQSYRQDANLRYLRLYGNLEVYALRNYGFYRSEPSTSPIANRVTLNIIQSMVDTVVSKLAKNKPKPTFITEGGDWDMQRKAKKLTQFVEGQFQATDFYAHRVLAIQDSCITGTGPLKIFRDGKDIKVEKTFLDQLTVDDTESVFGQPRQLHQRMPIHKDVLKGMFPKYEAEIEAAVAPSESEWSSGSAQQPSPMVEVKESWKLPSKKVEADELSDGKHVIAIKGATLLEEEWRRDYFPFVFWKWNVRPIGFWGQGLAEQLQGLQLEINKILRTIQVSMHLVSVPKLLVEASSKVVSAHLNNKIGGIIKYAGTAPTYAQLGSIPPELFAHLDRLYARAFEIAGISQLSAQSSKPAGLDSGKALREFNDIESERFLAVGQRDEDCCLQASKMMIDAAKEIHAEFGEYKVKVSSGNELNIIDWAEVDMDEDKYVMRCYPTSALSSTPAGKLQDVQDLLALGFLSKEDAMKLLDFPDLRQFYNFNNSGVENIEKAIELMIDKGQYETPEPYQNLEYGITKMQQAYLMYKTNGAPEARLELFRRWMEDANTLIQRAKQAQQADMVAQQAAMRPPAALPPGQAPQDLISSLPPTEYAAPSPIEASDPLALPPAEAPVVQ